MICLACHVEKATEFHGPTGKRLKGEGYCEACYQRAVRGGDLQGERIRWQAGYDSKHVVCHALTGSVNKRTQQRTGKGL